MTKRLLLVDFDGTFVDSMPALWECYNQFLEEHEKKGSRAEFERLIGPTIKELVIHLKKTHGLEEDEKILIERYLYLLQSAYAHIIAPIAGAVECLERAKEHQIKIGLVTSAPQDIVKKFLSNHLLTSLFDCIVTPLPDEPSKPDPAIYLRALHEAQTPARNAYAIEDSASGCKSASDAGIKVIALSQTKIPNVFTYAKDWYAVWELL